MTSIADFSVSIQISSESVPSIPCWLGEVVLLVVGLGSIPQTSLPKSGAARPGKVL